MKEEGLIIGCIADDFTGASDAASFLAAGGLNTILYNEIPKEGTILPGQCRAAVIALKTRTMETAAAVKQSLEAVEWLKKAGAQQIYFKYCSTFDSTREGNIGPVCDALLEFLDQDYTLLCPSLPVNGRTVKEGILSVYGVPLAESHMKNHPLTPMWDSDVRVLMNTQSRHPSFLEGEGCSGKRYYLIPDYVTEEDGERIAGQYGTLPFLTGGSGLLAHLARRHSGSGTQPRRQKGNPAPCILFAGSCSEATLEQIAYLKEKGYPCLKIHPMDLLAGRESLEGYKQELEAGTSGQPVLVYSSERAEQVKENQKAGKEEVAELLERTISELARWAAEKGCRNIIVAGGETSGAVTKALGYQSFWIGRSAAPGVPVMTPVEAENMRLVLKSGNFGHREFFETAIRMVQEGE